MTSPFYRYMFRNHKNNPRIKILLQYMKKNNLYNIWEFIYSFEIPQSRLYQDAIYAIELYRNDFGRSPS
jgi:hypothetical protein